MTESHPQHYPLIDAPINASLKIVEITALDGSILKEWLAHLGLFAGTVIMRHDDELHYHPLRVRGENGDVVIPAGFGLKTIVHIDNSDIRKPITEMEKGEIGHIESIGGGKGLQKALEKLGLTVDSKVTFLHDLPHMDYVTVIDRNHRTRLSEGEAAKIWGKYQDGREGQFYFSRKGEKFTVTDVLGGPRAKKHLEAHGVKARNTMVMETVEQAQTLHKPDADHVIISSTGGLRLYLTPERAERIIVCGE